MSTRGVATLRDQHTLPGGQTIVFHHPGSLTGCRPEPIQRAASKRAGLSTISLDAVRTPAAAIYIFGEGFGTFDLRRCLAGPEAGDTGVAHHVDHSEYQRDFGTDDHQVGTDLACQRDDVIAGRRRRRRAGQLLMRCRRCRERWPAPRPGDRRATPATEEGSCGHRFSITRTRTKRHSSLATMRAVNVRAREKPDNQTRRVPMRAG